MKELYDKVSRIHQKILSRIYSNGSEKKAEDIDTSGDLQPFGRLLQQVNDDFWNNQQEFGNYKMRLNESLSNIIRVRGSTMLQYAGERRYPLFKRADDQDARSWYGS
ncbi:hypothetical protein Tco_0016303 [Tanacetum coccineum]